MSRSRDATQGAGIESGTTMKKPITDAREGLGKSTPADLQSKGGGWPSAPTQKMDGHTFKNG